MVSELTCDNCCAANVIAVPVSGKLPCAGEQGQCEDSEHGNGEMVKAFMKEQQARKSGSTDSGYE